jgi:hypothetical protein
MSKKLIAVAAAAALALTGLVGAPASATVFGVTIVGQIAADQTTNNGSSATKAIETNVPTADVLRLGTDASASTGTLLRFTVATPGATDAVTVTTTGGAKVITATQFADGVKTVAGASSLTVPAAANSAVFYAFTTSTTAATVVVSAAGSSRTTFIKGVSTWAYKINFTASSAPALGGTTNLVGTVKDAFGNDLTTALAFGDFEITSTGGSATADKAAVATGNFTYDSTTKTYTIKTAVRDSAGQQAINLNVVAAKQSVKAAAFGDPVMSQFFILNATDLATAVTALTAQVAALTADYNALAAKWNKRVANKKAPKKAVTLK